MTLRPPVGTRAGGGTSDLLVNGARYDVYTPTTSNPGRIISAIAKKNTQAEGIVLDLSQSSVTREQLGNVLGRVQGAGAKSIKDIVIMEGTEMPGFDCSCGHRISYGEIPCQDEWLLISDVDFDGFSGLVEVEEVYRAMRSLLKCPVCNRLWVFWNGYQGAAQEFVLVQKATTEIA